MPLRLHKHVHQQAVDRLAVAADLLVAVHAVGGAFQPLQRALAGQQRQQRITAQLVVIVEVFVSQRQRIDPLRDQLPDLMLDAPGIAPVSKQAARRGSRLMRRSTSRNSRASPSELITPPSNRALTWRRKCLATRSWIGYTL